MGSHDPNLKQAPETALGRNPSQATMITKDAA
jgi:hypothetical protein